MEYLVIDIGTSSLRVLVMEDAARIAEQSVKKRHAPEIFDAEQLWEMLCQMAESLKLRNRPIAAVVVSSLLGWVGVDREGRAVCPCYTYMHAANEVFALSKQEKEACYLEAGRRPNPEHGVFQLLHVKRKDPQAYRNLAAFVSLKDYVAGKLTGRFAVDRTSAAYTLVYQLETGEWNIPLIERLEADPDKFPTLLAPADILGEVGPAAARAFGLAEGIPVAVGSVDGSTGIFGAGGEEEGTLVSVMGTTNTHFLVSGKPLWDESASLVLNPHVIPDRWLIGGPTGMYGGAVDWLCSTLLKEGIDLEELTAQAEAIPRGSEKVSFFPTMAGERTPFWQPAMRGTVIGLDTRHTAAHLLRAILEADSYVCAHMSQLAEKAGGEIKRVIAIGGGARSRLWLQIKAEVLGGPVWKTEVQEATARGSCLLAMKAIGQKAESRLEPVEIFRGEEQAEKEYALLKEQYLALHEKVLGLYA